MRTGKTFTEILMTAIPYGLFVKRHFYKNKCSFRHNLDQQLLFVTCKICWSASVES